MYLSAVGLLFLVIIFHNFPSRWRMVLQNNGTLSFSNILAKLSIPLKSRGHTLKTMSQRRKKTEARFYSLVCSCIWDFSLILTYYRTELCARSKDHKRPAFTLFPANLIFSKLHPPFVPNFTSATSSKVLFTSSFQSLKYIKLKDF